MIRFRFPLSRRAGFRAALVGVMVSAIGLTATVASALPAGTAPQNGGGITLSPASGAFADPFALRFDPSNQSCPGNNTTGWFFSPYLTADDPAQLVFAPTGSPQSALGGRTVALRNGLGELVRNQFPDLDTFIIAEPTGLSFAETFATTPLAPGVYNVGIACFNANAVNGLAARENAKFWNTQIDVTENGGVFSYATVAVEETTTTVADTTTTTTVAGETTTTTTTTVAGGTTTTTVAGGTTNATVTPSSPTAGGAYSVTFPNCTVGETITFSQPESSPGSVVDVCEASSALTAGSVAGLRMPAQVTTGTATGSFTAAPTAPGTYTITMTGTTSAQRTTTFVIIGASTPIGGGGNANANTGGSPTNSNTGTIPSTGSSTTSLIVWGLLLLVFGRMAILLGRKPKVLTGA